MLLHSVTPILDNGDKCFVALLIFACLAFAVWRSKRDDGRP